MGQYYRAFIKINGNKKIFKTFVDNEYMVAKLMEHSYWSNPYVLAIASKIYDQKGRIAWVGDYASAGDINWREDFEKVYDEDTQALNNLQYDGFTYSGKYLINHDKKMFIDLDKYEELWCENYGDSWIINPLPLLTAVGNGKGGGDYYGDLNHDLVGTWSLDLLEIVDSVSELNHYEDVTENYLFYEGEW